MVNIIYDFKHIHTVEVTGSNPVPPTTNIKGLQLLNVVDPFFFDKQTSLFYKKQEARLRPLKNVKFCSSSRKTKILTAGIH